MVKGTFGVLGAAALLAIGCSQAFALDPVPSVPLPTPSLPSVPVPTAPVSVPVVSSPVPSVPASPAPSASVPVAAPSVSAPVAAPSVSVLVPAPSTTTPTASLSESTTSPGSASGTSGSAPDQGSSNANVKGNQSSQSKAAESRSGTLRRFESRPPKFRSRGKGERGTTLVVWLSADSLVRFSFVQIAPGCRGVGGFTRAGEQGKNRFSFSGGIKRQPLGAGTYRIRAASVEGQKVTSIRRETVVVVAPGQSVHSAGAQKSTCGPGEEAVESRAAIALFADVGSGEPPSTGHRPVDAGSALPVGETGGSQAGGNGGDVVAPEALSPPEDFLVRPATPNLALGSDVDGGWPPPVIAAIGVMCIALLVIGARELTERFRRRDAGLP